MSKEDFWREFNKLDLGKEALEYAKEAETDIQWDKEQGINLFTYDLLYKNITELFMM